MSRQSGTYTNIQAWVYVRYGFTPQTCWIAHCKELNGLPVRRAGNRQGDGRLKECPPACRPAIEAAFRYFGILPKHP